MTAQIENWKPIPGFETKYQASDSGRIKSLSYNKTGVPKVLGVIINNHGYQRVGIFCDKGKYHQMQVHRLVAMTFIPNPTNLETVNHKDGNKLNNCVSNLEWVTRRQNLQHSYDTKIHLFGERHGASILNQSQVKEIKEEYATGTIGTRPLAKKFGVSRGCVTGILRGKNWKHL